MDFEKNLTYISKPTRNNMEYELKCPGCDKPRKYIGKSARWHYERAIKNKSVCLSCLAKSPRHNTPSHTTPHSEETKRKIREKRKLQKNVRGGSMKGKDNPFYGKKHTEEERYKMRTAIIQNLKDKGIKFGYKGANNYNPKACEFIDKLNGLLGLNLQHALNGGEIELYGYFADGYDKDKNIIFEYDEKYHRKPEHKNRDAHRQSIMIEKIQPSLFLRYDEKNNRLYDAETQSEIQIL
jgi:hypothetical protein